MVASSAYCSGLRLGFASIMSRIKMEKKTGEKTDPCGKPITCGLSSEQKSFTFNFFVLLHGKPLKYNFWKSRNNAASLCLLFL